MTNSRKEIATKNADVTPPRQPNSWLIRILNGGHNMPAFAGALKPAEVDALVTFLQSRKSH